MGGVDAGGLSTRKGRWALFLVATQAATLSVILITVAGVWHCSGVTRSWLKAVEETRHRFLLVGGVSPLVEEAAKQSIARLFGLFRQNEDGCRIPGCWHVMASHVVPFSFWFFFFLNCRCMTDWFYSCLPGYDHLYLYRSRGRWRLYKQAGHAAAKWEWWNVY